MDNAAESSASHAPAACPLQRKPVTRARTTDAQDARMLEVLLARMAIPSDKELARELGLRPRWVTSRINGFRKRIARRR